MSSLDTSPQKQSKANKPPKLCYSQNLWFEVFYPRNHNLLLPGTANQRKVRHKGSSPRPGAWHTVQVCHRFMMAASSTLWDDPGEWCWQLQLRHVARMEGRSAVPQMPMKESFRLLSLERPLKISLSCSYTVLITLWWPQDAKGTLQGQRCC